MSDISIVGNFQARRNFELKNMKVYKNKKFSVKLLLISFKPLYTVYIDKKQNLILWANPNKKLLLDLISKYHFLCCAG